MFDSSRNDLNYIKRFVNDFIVRKEIIDRSDIELHAWSLNDEPVPFSEARSASYSPIQVGDTWGDPWSTLWLKVNGVIPQNWKLEESLEIVFLLDLGFTKQPGFQAEGLIYTPEGKPVKAINPLNHTYVLPPGEIDFYVELAANPNVGDFVTFKQTQFGLKETAPEGHLYQIKEACIGLRSVTIWELQQDLKSLIGLADVLPENDQRRREIIQSLLRAVDVVDIDDLPGSACLARSVLAEELGKPANSSELTMYATGHAHIDSAWLWPVRETIRKCARTFSNVCDLLERYPEFTFSCSSAVQYHWMKEHYPAIFERIKEHVAEGRFVPVGGMWVECDANLTGGEALVRQFLYGKKFFLEEFGVDTIETWLPDSFGYSASLPQIAKLAGHRYFLTQKVSWNEYNDFPHHTFWWEGIDGSRQYTHFPPADTYNSELDAKELAFFRENFKEKGHSTVGLGLFGWGDGGGGPTPEHLAALKRHSNLAGSVKVKSSTAREFFEVVSAEYPDPPTWVGELYLELHRGALSAQLATKQGNRRSENYLREAELWAVVAHVKSGVEYPYARLEHLWKKLLLNQFHDILPGTSIAWVHDEAVRDFEYIREETDQIISEAFGSLKSGTISARANSSPLPQQGVDALAIARVDERMQSVQLEESEDVRTLSNKNLIITVDNDGNIVTMRDRHTDRNIFGEGEPGAVFQLYRDTPAVWDAWDIDRNYVRLEESVGKPVSVSVDVSEDEAVISFTYEFGTSKVTKNYILGSSSEQLEISIDIDWHEKKRMLKMDFPIGIRSKTVASEIQYGFIERPIAVNTMWDYARFEMSAHRWLRLAEGDFGIALANDSSYGFSCFHHVRSDGKTTTTVSPTLIRGPVYPDPRAEEGQYTVRFSLRPNATILNAYQDGYALNAVVRDVSTHEVVAPIVEVDSPQILVESVKMAEDRSGDVIVRIFEATGQSCQTKLRTDVNAQAIEEVDLIERSLVDGAQSTTDLIDLDFHPFEIKTLRIRRA
ncbi:MAG: glycoside hydrolase family 38 C-terminal domain-containing protein [Actinomycetaceae bacterium]|nr:glycoside hydrolase family 38 C-terminal domain-containing protein [Actinomycetaceae bacterium]